MVSIFYKLEGKVAVPVSNQEYHAWMLGDSSGGHRKVAEDEFLNGDVRVSTVFTMGINHNAGGNRPQLFETMVFGGVLDTLQWRYATWEEAESGHAGVLRELFKLQPELAPPVGNDIPTRFERILAEGGSNG
jgi:hypothetical protein